MIQTCMQLRGSFRIMNLYDVAESIDLEALGTLLGADCGAAERSFPRRTPEYVRFEHPPLVERAQDFFPSAGVRAQSLVKYYAFGVVVVQVVVPFVSDWGSLLEESSRWM